MLGVLIYFFVLILIGTIIAIILCCRDFNSDIENLKVKSKIQHKKHIDDFIDLSYKYYTLFDKLDNLENQINELSKKLKKLNKEIKK